MKKRTWLILLFVLILMQFIPYTIKNSDYDSSDDFFTIHQAPLDISILVQAACYDCHSQESKKPWYGYVAPVSFWINRHVRGGRMNLDFSNWGTLDREDQIHTLKEMAEEIENKEMPLSSYLIAHKEARLSDDDRNKLVEYFNKLTSQN